MNTGMFDASALFPYPDCPVIWEWLVGESPGSSSSSSVDVPLRERSESTNEEDESCSNEHAEESDSGSEETFGT